MLAALAPGRSWIGGALPSDDARSTARALRAMGAGISAVRDEQVTRVDGRRRLQRPDARLNCGNSGTTARLLLGVLAAHRFEATLTGDASLRRRPMRRVAEPLSAMGARITTAPHDGLPLTIRGGALRPLNWTLPVASAQLKSALLLAGALGGVAVTLREPAASRDHTERMLRHFGFEVNADAGVITLAPTGKLEPFELQVPGDPSSALFLLGAAALAAGGSIVITGVGLNPTRIGYVDVLTRMGCPVALSPTDDSFGEPIGTMCGGAARLTAVQVTAAEVPAMIDEIPMLACLAARAQGTSRFAGLAELRVKESDRLALLAQNLIAVGVQAAVEGDDLTVQGGDQPLAGRVVTGGDHRIAMAFMVLGTQGGSRIRVDDPECVSVSFPGFASAVAALFGRTG
jgi:3-phosphoshikimate 1-carboxyvinyltransferase